VTRADSSDDVEQLGSISCPSGVLVVLDGGLAWMWSHDRAPLLPEGLSIAATANSAVDLAIGGPDALAAGVAFNRQSHPLYLYDISRASLETVVQAFDALVGDRKLTASLAPLAERIPHRRRIDLALDHGDGVGEVPFHGIWAVTARGIPPDRPLAALGERMPAGPDEGRWRRVWIELRDGRPAGTRRIGHVLVDEARLMTVDADALGAWNDRDTLDGKADLVFWGRDAAAAAAQTGAPAIRFAGEGDLYGWADLPVDEALRRQDLLVAARSSERKFAFDLRPHTHHWQVMRDVRAAPTASGVLDLGGARLCMFMTTWGDGAFPVEADLDAAGQVLRLRIELGCAEIVQRQREMEELWFGEFAKWAIVSARIARDRQRVRFLYREAPDRPDDSGWRVFAGDEGDEYVNDAANAVLLSLRELLEHDRGLKELLRSPAPCTFERESTREPFRSVADFNFGEG
jgi:hypothetical protein